MQKRVEAIYPLSPSQQGMLLETLAAAGAGIHVEQFVYTLHGPLKSASFERAWQLLLQRHAGLRTGFLWENRSEPVQFVLQQAPITLTREDWRLVPTGEHTEALKNYLDRDRARGFMLSRVPLMRLALFQLAAQTFHFVWTCHHILIDGWCVPIILQELLSIYHGLERGGMPALPPARPYRDYIAWLKQQEMTHAEAFWRKRLSGFTRPTSPGLPGETDAAPSASERYGEYKVTIPTATLATLQELTRKHHLTLNSLFQGAWALLLHHYSGDSDVVFGITSSGRPPDLPGIESIIGLFINTLPLRVHVQADVTLADWLHTIQAQNNRQRPYEYCSAGQIHQWSDVPGIYPLYESVLVFENYPMDASLQESGDLVIDVPDLFPLGPQTKHALTVLISPGTTFEILVVYDQNRFSPHEAPRIGKHLLTILHAMQPGKNVAAALRAMVGEQIPLFMPAKPRQQRPPFAPPRDDLERDLAQLWEDALDTYPVGIHDNFFELGGHSLLAIGLLTRIKQSLGKDVSVAALLQHPSLAELASILRQDAAGFTQSPVVPLQRKGTRAPFFCVPGGGVNVTYLYHLANHLGGERPFYGLQPVGIDGQANPYADIEEMAAHYIAAIRRVQPTGPYYLGGHSFGGHVAFEMSQQLQQEGHHVAILIIIDAPAHIPEVHDGEDSAMLFQFIRLIERFFGQELDVSASAIRTLDEDGRLQYLLQRLIRARLLPAEAGAEQARGFLDVIRAQEQAGKAYVQEDVYPTRMALIRAQQLHPDDATLLADTPGCKSWGWQSYAAGPVETFFVPGDHVTMMAEPHVQTLARTINAVLAASS